MDLGESKKGGTVAYIVAGIGVLILAALLETPPPKSCPSGDVSAPCPSGYVPDPLNAGCCKPQGGGGGNIPYGTLFGTRIVRLRANPSVQGFGPDMTPAMVRQFLQALPPIDHINRFTDGSGQGNESLFISLMNAALPLMRTGKTDHAISARIGYGSNLVNEAKYLYDNVYSRVSTPQKALSVDVTPKLKPANFDAVIAALKSQGWKYLAWGAFPRSYAYSVVQIVMFGAPGYGEPSLSLVQQLSNTAEVTHLDESPGAGDFGKWLTANPTLQAQQAYFDSYYANQKNLCPAEYQLYMGNYYNALTGTTFKSGIPYPPLSYFAQKMTQWNP